MTSVWLRVDELGTALAHLPVAERVAPHPTADTVACLEHDDVRDPAAARSVAQRSPARPAPMTIDVVVGSSWRQNSVGCSGRITRGTPGHGT